MENKENNFLDKKTLIAVVLVGVFFFAWQKYLESKYPDFYKKKEVATEATVQTQDGKQTPPAPETAQAVSKVEKSATPLTQDLPVQVLEMQMGNSKFQISSLGMGLKNWTVENYVDREGKPIQIGLSKDRSLFEVRVADQNTPLAFKLEKLNENQIVGRADYNGTQIEQTLTFDHQLNAIQSRVIVKNVTQSFPGLSYSLPEQKHQYKSQAFFLPSLEHQEFVVRHEEKIQRVNASSEKEAVQQKIEHAQLTALGSQYFAAAFLDRSPQLPDVEIAAPITGELLATLTYRANPLNNQMQIDWTGYVGPKSMEVLQKIDPVMTEVVNLGFFTSIGKVLLFVLRWFHQFSGNWGVAIILLTLLVRMLVLPFNLASYKSMKKMQAIQPRLQSLRERYKEDPATMNRETMALMRQEKVNPLGGCLPMLLQMPVFFAFYQVLGQSIELYQAPFYLWIHDLSLKDPFFVLPVLMGITMFIQQKITPTTMDPQQAKILQFMPLIFSVFTLALPAGLTLYIFVSTLFAVVQQQLFMRDRKPALTTATAKT